MCYGSLTHQCSSFSAYCYHKLDELHKFHYYCITVCINSAQCLGLKTEEAGGSGFKLALKAACLLSLHQSHLPIFYSRPFKMDLLFYVSWGLWYWPQLYLKWSSCQLNWLIVVMLTRLWLATVNILKYFWNRVKASKQKTDRLSQWNVILSVFDWISGSKFSWRQDLL